MIIQKRYIYGYPDGTFKPEKKITRGEFTAIIGRLLDVPGGYHGENRFKDLDSPENDYIGYINNLAEIGLLKGYKYKKFKPHKALNIKEFEQIIERVMEQAEKSGQILEHINYKAWKNEQRNLRRAHQSIKRGECTKWINQIFGIERKVDVEKIVVFRDVPQTHWAYDAILASQAVNESKMGRINR